MTEITEHFLQEISSSVGYGKVAELHLFPPIRQGGQESGVAVIAATPETQPPEGRPDRHVVYMARYRQTLKGPDRGKWEFDLKAEADAPLITIDEVVRGVVQRSGDAMHPERMSGEQFRQIVSAPEGYDPAGEVDLAEVNVTEDIEAVVESAGADTESGENEDPNSASVVEASEASVEDQPQEDAVLENTNAGNDTDIDDDAEEDYLNPRPSRSLKENESDSEALESALVSPEHLDTLPRDTEHA